MARTVQVGDAHGLPKRTVLSDETYSAIRDMLMDHSIAPGERINIDQLAKALGVSQTPIRESLARLESEDLVAKEPLKGYAATSLLTVAEVADLFQFRLLLEPWASERAARRCTPRDSEALEAELKLGAAASGLDVDAAYAAMAEHDARFHELIAHMSGSDFVRDAYARTHCHLHLFRLYQAGRTQMQASNSDSAAMGELFSAYYQPTTGFLAFREHEAIAKAIIAGESETARDLMRGHIESSRVRFAPAMEALNGIAPIS
jgi:DNA-binding GntR family transcriptional regulator